MQSKACKHGRIAYKISWIDSDLPTGNLEQRLSTVGSNLCKVTVWKNGKTKSCQINGVTQKILLLNYGPLSRLLIAKEKLSSLASRQKQHFCLISRNDLNVKSGFWGRNPAYFQRSFFCRTWTASALCIYVFFKIPCIFRKWYHMNMLVKLAWGFYSIYIQQKKSLSIITYKLIGPLQLHSQWLQQKNNNFM